eukprot:CAMPEP_0206245036 /NCGR_PEP_ID=MMETSP0047_2-20121206/18481_1 /ASSEMBLY_ACC=CAM_ASM_000192 /TAXON_ID=195065 /ORGANISM="Chroomonas mesostigmatica_cf, Strain CCMP1168" /LENGTH=346 /DNA_ID=CAMNT_0053670305 /DNA_START=144 /DNA_END=1184 /DNA_ORIENTATION=+
MPLAPSPSKSRSFEASAPAHKSSPVGRTSSSPEAPPKTGTHTTHTASAAAGAHTKAAARSFDGPHKPVAAKAPSAADAKPKYGLAVKKVEDTKPKSITEAFKAKNVAVFRELLAANANPTEALNAGDNPLLCQAARMNLVDFIQVIMDTDPWAIIAQDPESRNALHHAALNGSLEVCKVLMEKKPERVKSGMLLGQLDKTKMNPLLCGILSGSEAVVEYLIEVGEGGGADVPNALGVYALHMASSKGMAKAVKLLCKLPGSKKAGSQRNHEGSSPLHLATMEGYDDVVKILLDEGVCSPDLQDEQGWTALHLAYAMEMDSIAAILEPRTDAKLKDSDGRTAAELKG